MNTINDEPTIAPARPHVAYLAVLYKDKHTGNRVEFTLPLQHQPTADGEQQLVQRLSAAAIEVIEHAAENADATVTLALLRQGQP